ncbi:MAG: nickel pincer cofactor biosynthesis protein LarC [Verrucomicrobia bacterium]|nr:nickel pincer cofactor biosynthesis protein LarC [Verrucomicrobiota bacterium]
MQTLYLDTFSGISGDMFIGAMIDLGVDVHALEHELAKLKLDGYHLHAARKDKAGIAGVKFDVHLPHAHGHQHEHSHAHSHGGVTHAHEHGHAHSHEHHHGDHGHSHGHDHPHEHGGDDHEHRHFGPHGGPLVFTTSAGQVELSVFETNVPPRFRLYFSNADGKKLAPPAAKSVTLETLRDKKKRQDFSFKRHGDYLEATDELPEPHEFRAILTLKKGGKFEKVVTEFVEEHHHHEHDHGHEGHSHEHGGDCGHCHEHPHDESRNFADIQKLIHASKLSVWVKEKSIAVFHRIAVAEGKIHGHPPEKVHFHEVGAVDSIVDIVGACLCLEMLGKPRVLASLPVEGTGTVRCAHGRLPLPAPATLEILGARGVALTQCEEPHELITPTGAALLAEFAESFGPMRGLIAKKVGYGLGTRDNHTRPNVLRAVLSEEEVASVQSSVFSHRSAVSPLDWEADTITVLETNLDDISAEILGAFVEQALAAGALDVFHTPIQMKKNRPGVLLTVLCAAADADKFSEMMLRETSAFGVRRTTAERRKLKREFATVKLPQGKVTVKLGRLNGKVVQASPEFESCRKVAEKSGVPLKEIYAAALRGLK